MTARLIEDMPFEDYLAHPALSASGMKHLLDSPARYRWEKDNPSDSPAMSLGRLIHAIAFDQPHNYVVKDWDGRTKEGKARAAEVAEQGLEFVSDDDWAVAQGIADALKANRLASGILFSDGVQHEVSAFWTDPETGVDLKCRYDAVTTALGCVIGDLKSTVYAKPESFAGSAAKYGYFTGAAQYRAGAIALDLHPEPEYFLIAVEKKQPHFISVNGINEVDLHLGEQLRRKAIRRFAECTEAASWPDYTDEIAYPSSPVWWQRMVEEETGLLEVELSL